MSTATRTASALVRAPVFPMALDRWLRTVPSESVSLAAISVMLAPSRALVSSVPDSGLGSERVSALVCRFPAASRAASSGCLQDIGLTIGQR